ncbi:MAG: UDP-N-acetylglucosamine--N-acetylmuramyl-(pentapeptide) pyrophosphoryl-undecaprenol N-acetylglucosamine transferase [Acidimicrobiales bacterium]
MKARFLLAGGGTAGHTVPAIAVARALVAAGADPASIRFVGARRGSEGRLVPKAGFAITLLPGRGIQRRLTPANVAAGLGISAAFFQALRLVATCRPSAVLSVGGYAGVPVALAAAVLRRPLVVAEANAVPGAANRMAARFARVAAVSFEGTPLPRAVLTGNPVRAEVLAIDRSPAGRTAAKAALGLPPGRVVIGVSGGSLGARRLNDAVRDLAGLWSDRSDVAIHHAVGKRDWASFVPPGTSGLHYRHVEYEDRMDLVLTAADLWLGRAGGSTCAELGVAGVPAVLVPLPGAPGDHQTANARAMAGAGAAVVLADADCSGQGLDEVLGPLVADSGRREAMGAAALTVGHPDAAERVAALLLEHAQ